MINTTYNLELVKEQNRTMVIEILNSLGTTTRTELANITGLTRATITNIINEFLEVNLIEEIGTIDGNVGRKRKLIKINDDAFYAMGIEFGVNIIRTGIFDLSGKNISFSEKEINSYAKPTDILENIYKVIDETFSNCNSDIDKIKGIGILMPGIVDSEKKVIESVHPFPLLKNYPVCKQIEKHYNIPTWLENDANGAALGEKWFGHGKNYQNYVFVVGDAGIGAGIIINGQLYRGASNSAGEIGHTIFSRDFVQLETEGGLYKLTEKYKLPIEELLKISKNNPEVHNTLCEINQALAIGIVNLVNILNPEAVIIGGRILSGGYHLIREIKRIVGEYTFANEPPKILVATKKESAILAGAASIAIEQIVSSPYQFLLKDTPLK
ncbi:MAG TPA: ROK family transcriptional regulator [Defluviitoga sp.]|nr:ROK family transcriptional regulator [Defluviitoga sp.]